MPTSLRKKLRKIGTLGRAWRVILENGRSSRCIDTRREIEEFAVDAEARLTKIQRQLNLEAFTFEPARGVAIPKKGKNAIRPLVIAPIESRIVQRAIHDVLLAVPAIRRLAESPYSFGGVRKQKGKTISAVPAAIQAVLDAIQGGAAHVIRSDITSFFTRIPKATVTQIVAAEVREPEFAEIFTQAITIELANLAELRQRIDQFPTHEIGVAQGNSLSPLLGNLLLFDFDAEMNHSDWRCIRYVDDFIILAPSYDSAERAFALAKALLQKHGLQASAEKTVRSDITRGFEFLGIELANGALRPSKESRKKLRATVSAAFDDSASEMRSYRRRGTIDRAASLIRTLHEVAGVLRGWGNHYSFCNEKNVFLQLDRDLDEMLRQYLGNYKDARRQTDAKGTRRLLGVPLLEELASRPFTWSSKPTPTKSPQTNFNGSLPFSADSISMESSFGGAADRR